VLPKAGIDTTPDGVRRIVPGCVSAGDRSQQYSDCCSRLDETAPPEMRMI
jgi:hypothetical protein